MTLNLAHVNLNHVEGVYVIWVAGPRGTYAVRVGQGVIRDRLGAHRLDPMITRHQTNGTLYATWASVLAADRSGVELFLSQQWNLAEGSRFPNVSPIPVNLPGQ